MPSLRFEAQNPVCTDQLLLCRSIVSSALIFEAGQEFSEVDIDDSLIFATLIGTTPIPTPETDVEPEIETETGVTLADIVADVAAGNKTYAGKIITITASVATDVSAFNNRDAIT